MSHLNIDIPRCLNNVATGQQQKDDSTVWFEGTFSINEHRCHLKLQKTNTVIGLAP